jgi:hypothetical protein
VKRIRILLCRTCTQILKRWLNISHKCIFQLCTYLVEMTLSYSPIYVFLLCYSEFDAQTWRSNPQPTQKQLDNMRRSGIQGRPNFVTWFNEHALRASNVHHDLHQLSYGYITVRRYGRYDVNGFRFRSTIFEDARPLAATCNT